MKKLNQMSYNHCWLWGHYETSRK